MLTQVYLGVGSNLNRENALRFACARLGEMLDDFRVSSVWRSRAVRAQPDYYNMVVGGSTGLEINELCLAIERIEKDAGTEPMFHEGTNFGLKPRLDIDVLLYGSMICISPCKLPRHDIQDYPFVLCPLCEIDPEVIHPLLNIKVIELWREMEPRLPDNMRISKVQMDLNGPLPDWKREEKREDRQEYKQEEKK